MGPLKKTDQAAETGDLLDVVALDSNGVIVTTEGALVRILEVTPRNPTVMGLAEQQRVSEGFAAMAGRLKVGQSLQFYIEASPIELEDVIDRQREEIDRRLADHDPDVAMGLRQLAHAHEQSLREHASDQAAVRFRAYVIVPYLPAQPAKKVDWDALRPSRWRGVPHAPLTRALQDHERVLRESLVHSENITSDLQALDLSTQLLTGPEVAELLYRRFNPSSV
ncbi:MAG: hypothetical protein ACLGI7_02220, partial [Gammaproteobacteria bacterium]